MRGNGEIRERAWHLLWQGRWFWKLLGGAILLNVCSQVVYSVLNGLLYRFGVFGMTALTNALEEYAKNRTPLPEITPSLVTQFVSSTALTFFFLFIMASISAYGNSALLLRAVDEKNEGWLKAAFGGFAIPLGLAWLFFRMFLIFLFWYVVALLPSVAVVGLAITAVPPALTPHLVAAAVYTLAIVAALCLYVAIMCMPFYRYRYVFRIKAEHPDWAAGRCIGECAMLTDGSKWRCFVHDCSYWKILLVPLLLLLFCVAAVCGIVSPAVRQLFPEGVRVAVAVVGAVVLIVSYLAMFVFALIICFYIGVGQTLLYRDILQEKANQQ